jgi:hypothetical protein
MIALCIRSFSLNDGELLVPIMNQLSNEADGCFVKLFSTAAVFS